jgi:hypothetical protein
MLNPKSRRNGCGSVTDPECGKNMSTRSRDGSNAKTVLNEEVRDDALRYYQGRSTLLVCRDFDSLVAHDPWLCVVT